VFRLHCLDILDLIGLLSSCAVSEEMHGGKVKDLEDDDAIQLRESAKGKEV
jgi:hypothetical protein